MKLINTKLYSNNQKGTREYIKKYLTSNDVSFSEYDGCLVSIKDLTKPLFVAHMDTVGETSVGIPVVWKGNIMKRKVSAVLGADDKAGVNLILNHCKTVNFVFTRDEEIGCLGASALLRNDVFIEILGRVPCAIELDRRGSSDIIEYCAHDLTGAVMDACPGYKPAQGLFTDVTEWDHIVPSVNLSVGYYNPHTNNEYLSLDMFKRINDYIPELDKIRGSFKLFPSTYNTGYNSYGLADEYDDLYDMYGKAYDNSKDCDFCATVPSTLYKDPDGYLLCEQCLQDYHGITVVIN